MHSPALSDSNHPCIHHLFEAQVAHSPESTALVFEGERLSYSELNARANRLAHRLIALDVRPDQRVAICVERSLAMVVGLMAILKAGGAYVPLDPENTGERLAFMLADAAPILVLADTAGRRALGTALQGHTVLDPREIYGEAGINPDVVDLRCSHLAYIIYTSGSTGQPKGVMVEHAQVWVDLIIKAQQLGGYDSNAVPSMEVQKWKSIHHFSRMACAYKPTLLPFNIHCFHALESGPQLDTAKGWRTALPGIAMSSISIPGNHLTMMEDVKNRKHLADAFSQVLVQESRPHG